VQTTNKSYNNTTRTRKELLELWQNCLTTDQPIDPFDAVVTELSEYFQMPSSEVRHHCLNWEEESLTEWQASDRSTTEGIYSFYQTQVSWIFDTMRYHADQCKSIAYPETVEVAQRLNGLTPGYHLDFGAGPGTSSLFFHALGWQVALADISTTFIDFVRWRLDKHGVNAPIYNMAEDKLPVDTFDLITAFDVIVHVPNATETIADLHRALRPGGYLVFNIDIRPRRPETEYHLYHSHHQIIRSIRQLGFQRHRNIDSFYVYQKVRSGFYRERIVSVYDGLRHNECTSMLGKAMRTIRGK
jgi:2-polyprenyl-3-methyl-5-hydroxy-6-metoxy-1,4-benzoquinol methylase